MFTQDRIPLVRLTTALGQGLALFLLYSAFSNKVWPATDPYVFMPAILLAFFLPLSFSAGIGHIRRSLLVGWLAVASVVIVGIGVYCAYAYDTTSFGIARPRLDGDLSMPGAAIRPFAFLCIVFLIAQTALVAGSAEQRRLASYRAYFDFGWKHVIQLAVMFVFTLVFWLMMFLGAALFDLIGLKFLRTMIEKAWFVLPASALVVATALHVTDVRPSMTLGIRTLTLTLLSWLLLPMTAMVCVFLVSLPFTGLAPLWATQSAAALLLAVSAALIVLINAVYQDGAAERALARVLKITATTAAVSLLPLALIAAYALYLRVDQYGWTPDRVLAAALVTIVLGFAGGYVWAAAARGPWLAFIEKWNPVMAGAVAVIFLALFTPIADPARITASNQIARLEADKVSADDFDYNSLRFEAGRYGVAALKELATTGAATIKARAIAALEKVEPYGNLADRTGPVSDNLIVATSSRPLPQSFLDQDWTEPSRDVPSCIRQATSCDALVIDLNSDGADEILLFPRLDNEPVRAFRRESGGTWEPFAHVLPPPSCNGPATPLRADPVTLVPAQWPDIDIGGERFRLELSPTPPRDC